MKLKLKLMPEEINEYNEFKNKIQTARTKSEIKEYELRAKSILETGRIRYVNELEKEKNNLNISSHNPSITAFKVQTSKGPFVSEAKSGNQKKWRRARLFSGGKLVIDNPPNGSKGFAIFSPDLMGIEALKYPIKNSPSQKK